MLGNVAGNSFSGDLRYMDEVSHGLDLGEDDEEEYAASFDDQRDLTMDVDVDVAFDFLSVAWYHHLLLLLLAHQ